MLGPFPLADALARARAVPGVRLVGNAADLDAAQTTPPTATPAVFVLRDESGDKSIGTTGRPQQNVGVVLKLVLWIRNAGGAEKMVAAMDTLERDLRTAFFGWRPTPEFRPLTIRNSGAEQAYGDQMIRQLLLTTSYTQTMEATP